VQSRRWILLGAGLTTAGIAVAGTAPELGTATFERIQGQQTIGGIAVVAGWGVLAWGIHRFGREQAP
jgi:hypothetical protein